MPVITNNSNISLGLAVWLLHDEYDYINEPNYISVTQLMKPIRHIILPKRVPKEQRTSDVEDYISSALGKSLHDSIEKAWLKSYAKSLALLGYPKSLIDRVLINPTPEQLAAKPDAIPVYLEQRAIRDFEGYRIGGKFDMVAEGIVQDNKSTTAYTWLMGTRDDDYALQGSLYRWLNPDKITEDYIRINFIFTDWQKAMAKANPKYPQKRLLHKDIPLWSLEKTEAWIRNKIAQLQKYKDAQDEQIPECTDAELWRSEPKYKYFSDPTKTAGKSTKNFDDPVEARVYMANEKGGKGIVITVPGEVKRCDYCDAAPICKQREKYITPA